MLSAATTCSMFSRITSVASLISSCTLCSLSMPPLLGMHDGGEGVFPERRRAAAAAAPGIANFAVYRPRPPITRVARYV